MAERSIKRVVIVGCGIAGPVLGMFLRRVGSGLLDFGGFANGPHIPLEMGGEGCGARRHA